MYTAEKKGKVRVEQSLRSGSCALVGERQAASVEGLRPIVNDTLLGIDPAPDLRPTSLDHQADFSGAGPWAVAVAPRQSTRPAPPG